MVFKSRYEELKEAPLWWHNKAQDLHASAGSLWLSMNNEYKDVFCEKLGFGKSFDLYVSNHNVYYMLFGLSFELLFKSILVLRDPTKRVPENHNLLYLANEAKIDLNRIEKAILDLLSEYVIWVGKYPIPKDEKELNNYNDKFAKAAVNRIKINNITIEKYNGVLEWDQINTIWNKTNKIFFEEYQI